jgi:bifunctional non-homologous end joining protein LigD
VIEIPPAGSAELEIDGRRIELTSLDKALWPHTGFTKGDMIRYYAAVSPAILPQVEGRALTLGRWPDGVEGRGFPQTECRGRPDWMPTTSVTLRNGEVRRHCLVADLAALLWVANQNAIELHAFLHRSDDPLHPTAALFDLDPGPESDILHCCQVALDLRDALEKRGLRPVVKTSGSTGLHVLVPWDAPREYAESKAFVRSIAGERVTGDGVRVDWAQNNPGRTLVAAYSLRATRSPTASLPVGWHEIEQVAKTGDPGPLFPSPAEVAGRNQRSGGLSRT